MKKTKKRALCLYHRDTPFKPKVVQSKKIYSRKKKRKYVNEN